MAAPSFQAFLKSFVPSLWLGMLGAPLIWAAHLQLLYVLVPVANKTQSHSWLYLTTAVCCVLCLACGVVSWRDWRAQQTSEPLDSNHPAGRTRFLSVVGMVNGVFFALTILATGLASYFFKTSWV